MDDYRRYDGLTEAIADLLGLIIAGVVGIVTFLLVRIDILNSLVISTVPLLYAISNGYDGKICLAAFIISSLIAFLLQKYFAIARIICGIFTCFVVVFFCWDFRQHDTMQIKLITMGTGLAIAAFLNIRFWYVKDNS